MNERLNEILGDPQQKQNLLVGVATLVVTSAGTFFAGYFLGKRRYQTTYQLHELPTVFEREPFVIDEEVYEGKKDVEELGEEFVKERVGATEPAGSQGDDLTIHIVEEIDEEDEEIELERRSVFANDGWDLEEEMKNRRSTEPYVIHKDEYFEDDQGFTQVQLTYYAGDDMLCDEEDKPVYNFDRILGQMKFGHGSGDPAIFYVRNETRRAEYEVVRNDGHYSVEVLGLEMEVDAEQNDLRHSNSPGKFRRD